MTIGMGGHSPSNILHHLKGVAFPAKKDGLLAQARKNEADDDVLKVIRQLPEGEYQSMADVLKGVGKAS